jgi:predicted DsbA family dithiol-disulfide isomerase
MRDVLDRRSLLALLGASALAACESDRPGPAPAPAAPALRVEVWHDTVCPWCRIGLHNLGVALDRWTGSALAAVYHPFLLEPDAPAAGEDLRERLGRKYGAARLPEMFARVSAAGARYGVRFDWDRVRRAPLTVGSHALIAHAPEPRRRAVVAAVHRAYFEEGTDIGDTRALASLAAAAGLDEAAALRAIEDPAAVAVVRRGAAEATARGIDGVPHFVIGARTLHGAQSPEALAEALSAALPRPRAPS